MRPQSALEQAAGMRLRGGAEDEDEEFAELALGDATVDRLLGGECLVDQLAESLAREASAVVFGGGARRAKKRRTRTIELLLDRRAEQEQAQQHGQQAEAAREPADEEEDDDDDGHDDDDDDVEELARGSSLGLDDGADALIAEFGGGEVDADADADADPDAAARSDRKRLRSVSGNDMPQLPPPLAATRSSDSSEAAAATMRVCRCGHMSRASLTSLADVDDEPADAEAGARAAIDLYSASREYLDLHLRYAVVVRVVDVEVADSQTRYVIRVEDAETQKRWEVRKTFKEMVQFYSQVKQISMADAPVRKSLWGTFRGLRNYRLPTKFMRFRSSLSHQRRAVFDSFLRQTAALVSPAPLGPRRRRAVLLLQEFVGVHRHCDVFDRGGCNCLFVKSQVNATQLVSEIFSGSSHPVTKECEKFVETLTAKSRDDRNATMPERKARTLLNAVARKMGELRDRMLKDEILQRELAAARDELGDEYDDFLDDVRHAISAQVQKSVFVSLEDHVHEALHAFTSESAERRLRAKIKVMQSKPQSFFGIPQHVVSANDWEDARREMRRVNDYALPLDKLKCIVRAAAAVFHARLPLHQTLSGNSLTSVEEVALTSPSLSTDEFIPVNLFVLVMSNMSNVLLTRELLRLMCDCHDVTGEIGYYLTSFEVVVDLLERQENPHEPFFSP